VSWRDEDTRKVEAATLYLDPKTGHADF
jgi:hypothetical protein